MCDGVNVVDPHIITLTRMPTTNPKRKTSSKPLPMMSHTTLRKQPSTEGDDGGYVYVVSIVTSPPLSLANSYAADETNSLSPLSH
jgi:hypothetical protein